MERERKHVRLAQGDVWVELDGAAGGPLVVFVHGLTSPCLVWECLVSEMVEAGFRVLRYDLYGRGRSAKPEVRYDQDLYCAQLHELIDALSLGAAPFFLVGLSMGGAIVTEYTLRYPAQVRALSLLAPAGFAIPLQAWMRWLLRSSWGEPIMQAASRFLIKRGMRRAFYDPRNFSQFADVYREQLRSRAYRRAVISSMRDMPLFSMEARYQLLGTLDIPVQLMWGKHDLVLPFENHKQVQQSVPSLSFVAVEDAGHTLQCDQPKAVGDALRHFWANLEQQG